MHEFLNFEQIKAEEAEARAKVRDEEGEVLHTFHNRKIVRISEDLVVKKAKDLRIHEVSNLRFIAGKQQFRYRKCTLCAGRMVKWSAS